MRPHAAALVGRMDSAYLLAIDQGTTGTTSLLMDTSGATLGRATREFRQHFPEPGLVEHDPEEIWQSVQDAVGETLRAARLRFAVTPEEERGLLAGIQREIAIEAVREAYAGGEPDPETKVHLETLVRALSAGDVGKLRAAITE